MTGGALSRALRTPVPAGLRDALVAAVTSMNTAHDMTIDEGGARGQE
jgi:hypothetical protein